MKNLLAILMFLITISAYAQTNSINYKAIIKDGSGNVVANQSVTVQFTILSNAVNVYQETHAPTTDANGIVILNIGTGTTTDIFTDIDWNTFDHTLNVQVNIGAGLVDMGTTSFSMVPYALSAANVSGLEAISNGWRLVGVNPDNYGPIGNGAVDLSYNLTGNATYGAKGNNSFANGIRTEASGFYSVAMGDNTTASGSATTAMGHNTAASGFYSTAIGDGTIAEARSSTAIGRHNLGGGDPINWTGTDPLFEIGNGTSSAALSNALTILKNGTITAPSFDLAEITNNKALITKEFFDTNTPSAASGLEALDEGNGIGYRLKGADPANYGIIGDNAMDLSYNSVASTTKGATGLTSTAFGGYNTASGIYSTAMGNNTLAYGYYSTSLGASTKAEAYGSTAIGRYNIGGGTQGNITVTDPLFEVGNGTSSIRNNALTILNNGKVGIGEHQPTGFLEIKAANNSTTPNLKLVHEGTTGARINFTNTEVTNGNRWTLYGDPNDVDANSVFNIYHPNAGNIVRVYGDGNVGIGTAPSYKLDVRGSESGDYTAQIYNTSTNANADGLKIRVGRTTAPTSSNSFVAFFDGSNTSRGRIQGNGTGVTYATTSDERLKTNIEDISNALELINKIKPRLYEYRANLGVNEYGFIAQELKPIYSQAVIGTPNSDVKKDPMMVDYGRLTPLLTAGIKELNAKVKSLEAENKSLKQKLNQLEQLEARLSAIENKTNNEPLTAEK